MLLFGLALLVGGIGVLLALRGEYHLRPHRLPGPLVRLAVLAWQVVGPALAARRARPPARAVGRAAVPDATAWARPGSAGPVTAPLAPAVGRAVPPPSSVAPGPASRSSLRESGGTSSTGGTA